MLVSHAGPEVFDVDGTSCDAIDRMPNGVFRWAAARSDFDTTVGPNDGPECDALEITGDSKGIFKTMTTTRSSVPLPKHPLFSARASCPIATLSYIT